MFRGLNVYCDLGRKIFIDLRNTVVHRLFTRCSNIENLQRLIIEFCRESFFERGDLSSLSNSKYAPIHFQQHPTKWLTGTDVHGIHSLVVTIFTLLRGKLYGKNGLDKNCFTRVVITVKTVSIRPLRKPFYRI